MTHRLLVGVFLSLSCAVASADIRELIDEPVLAALAAETSGEAAKRNLDSITLQHRMRSGTQFDAATQYIHETLLHYGLDDVEFVTYMPVSFTFRVRGSGSQLRDDLSAAYTRGTQYFRHPKLAAAISKKYKPGDMKVSFWKKHGRWVLLLVLVGGIGVVVVRRLRKKDA